MQSFFDTYLFLCRSSYVTPRQRAETFFFGLSCVFLLRDITAQTHTAHLRSSSCVVPPARRRGSSSSRAGGCVALHDTLLFVALQCFAVLCVDNKCVSSLQLGDRITSW